MDHLKMLKRKLKITYYFREITQMVLVYFFGILSLVVIVSFIYLLFFSPTKVENLTVKSNMITNNDTLYGLLFGIGFILLLVFYVVYAFYFYPKKHRKDINRINYFIDALQRGEKIVSHHFYPLQIQERNLFYDLWRIQYGVFNLTDNEFKQVGVEEMFLVPASCHNIIKVFYIPNFNPNDFDRTY